MARDASESQVPADDAVDLADQFNVEAVPTFVLLRVRAKGVGAR